MRVALATIGERAFEGSAKPEQFKPILFALAFFHALVLGRRRFGSLGFSRAYPFSAGDFAVCAHVLGNYLEAKDAVPWSDLRYIVGDIMCARARARQPMTLHFAQRPTSERHALERPSRRASSCRLSLSAPPSPCAGMAGT